MNIIADARNPHSRSAALAAVLYWYGEESPDTVLEPLRLWMRDEAQGVWTVADRIAHRIELDGGSLTAECEVHIHTLLEDIWFQRFDASQWAAPTYKDCPKMIIRVHTTNEAARELVTMIEDESQTESSLEDDLKAVRVKHTKVGGYIRFPLYALEAVKVMVSLAADLAGEAVYNASVGDDKEALEAHAKEIVELMNSITIKGEALLTVDRH